MAGMLLASDLNNKEFVNASDPDAALHVTFYNRPVLQTMESELAGRAIYKNVEYVKIVTAGDDKNIIDRPVRQDHIFRFKSYYDHWKKYGDGGSENIGVALSKWALLGDEQVENLKAAKFYTVEQIANASDTQLESIGMCAGMAGKTLQQKAKQYLASLRNNENAEAEAAKEAAREKEAQELRAQNAAMAKQMQDMQAMLEKLTAPAANTGTITKQNAKAA